MNVVFSNIILNPFSVSISLENFNVGTIKRVVIVFLNSIYIIFTNPFDKLFFLETFQTLFSNAHFKSSINSFTPT